MLNLALKILASILLGISWDQWQRLINVVTALEGKAIDKIEKHAEASALLQSFINDGNKEQIKAFVAGNTSTVLGAFVKLALIIVRRNAS
ncbi:hypothetical protein ABZN20_02220 [Methylococcus sp. ANG]|uniref:hypothetical protein n=1 Tax=Methylococcus sp. ANG TaxID=3231903 RepID=UPI0034592E19